MTARIIPESSPNAGQRRNCGSTRRAAGFRLTIFCAKQWTGSKKPNRSARPVTTMRFCGGTPARASLNETNSSRAKKKNESNFLSSKIVGQPLRLPRTLAGESACPTLDVRNGRRLRSVRARGLATGGGQIRFRVVVADEAIHSLAFGRRQRFGRDVGVGYRLWPRLRVRRSETIGRGSRRN